MDKLKTLTSDTKKVQEMAEKRRIMNGVGTLTEYWNYCDIPLKNNNNFNISMSSGSKSKLDQFNPDISS
jgi:hypothetical protein